MVFSRLIRFQASESEDTYFFDRGGHNYNDSLEGKSVLAFKSFDDLVEGKQGSMVTVGRVYWNPF